MVTAHFNWMFVGWREWERLHNWCLGVYINMAQFQEAKDSAKGECDIAHLALGCITVPDESAIPRRSISDLN